ncbi:MAG: chloride channel protein [Lachnospiraceae bacterium]|nr:chloride channel protein [Lachnospiraceae bacterium]MCI9599201.1 chloride channel protein [Lachnospiraceae bacterium]
MKKFVEICAGRVWLLVRWLVLAGITGAVLGILGGLFGRSITAVTVFRGNHPWMLYLLPLAGLGIVAMYRLDPYKTGTNRVLEGIQSNTYIPLRTAPLIAASTVITHAFGASAGREGAALQLGGSIGGTIGKWLKMDDYDHKILIMCGMSAGFSALFGTPLTATVFAMEVVSVGIMQYAALVPCSVAALTAKGFAEFLGAHGEHFALPAVTAFDWRSAGLTVLLALCCAAVSILFCVVLHCTEHLYKKWIPDEWLRITAGGCLVILMTKLLGTTDYLGAGMDVIELAMEGKVIAAAFLVKMVFTAVSLGSGFRGGEIVPTLFVGATFGCLFGQVTGLSPSLAAACGMASVFCGVTNCPVSSLLLSFELFGFECMPFFLLSVSIAYLESGYYGLYHSQKILYSKTKLKFINTYTKE